MKLFTITVWLSSTCIFIFPFLLTVDVEQHLKFARIIYRIIYKFRIDLKKFERFVELSDYNL